LICSVIQIDSFWKTLVLSNDCESSMRAIVIEPPRFGVAALRLPPATAVAAVVPRAARPRRTRKRRDLRAMKCPLLRDGPLLRARDLYTTCTSPSTSRGRPHLLDR